MKLRLRTVLVALAMAVVAGCGGGVNILELDAKAHSATKTINNSSLESDATILGGKPLYQGDIMQCFVNLQSNTNDSQKLYYKFFWFDADGAQLGDDHWSWINLLGHQPKTINASAPTPRAERAQFLLRRRSTDDHEN